jgi:hypothetical protein
MRCCLIAISAKIEEKLLERLGEAVLDVINNPKKTQRTICIGAL